jgi:hypothetical protein
MRQITKSGNGTDANHGLIQAKPEEVKIFIPELKLGLLTLTIDGDTPLVVHRFAEKARQEMLDKQMGKAKQKKERKDPEACFLGALYPLDGTIPKLDRIGSNVFAQGKFGFPAGGLKKATVAAARQLDGLKMTFLRGAFHIQGMPPQNLIEIIGTPKMREDTVRLSTGVADVRFRPEFWPWSARFIIRYNQSVITPSQLAHLVNTAGFAVGLAENRPEKGGDWGMFHVSSSAQVEAA